MKFNNWNLRLKLFASFGILIIASLVISSVSFYQFKNVKTKVVRLDSFFKINEKLATWDEICTNVVHTGDTSGMYIVYQNIIDIKAIYEKFASSIVVEANRALYNSMINELDSYQENWEKYQKNQDALIKLNDALDEANRKINYVYEKNVNNLSKEFLMANRELVKMQDAIHNLLISNKPQYESVAKNYFNSFKKIVINQKIKEFEPYVEFYSNSIEMLLNLFDEETHIEKELEKEFGKIDGTTDKMTNSIYEGILSAISSSIKVIITFSIITILLCVLIVNTVARTLDKDIKKCVSSIERVADGNLNLVFDKETLARKDEFGQLLSAIYNTISKQRTLIGGIIDCATEIKDASNVMNNSSQTLSQGANEQASSIEEVSSSMEEMAANIQQNSENAQQANSIVNKMNEGMSKINDAASRNYSQAKEIADKISIVNLIASQTNILALNAAVEAARAGEHGRGFAVVASEVRKLAERSKIAADEITKLTQDIVHGVEETGSILTSTMPDVKRSIELIKEIAIASSEQNAGTAQVNSAVQQMNQIAQHNAAASEEIATNAEELSSQADQMADMTRMFII